MTSTSTGIRAWRGSTLVRLVLAVGLLAAFAVFGAPSQAHAADNGKWSATPIQGINSQTPREYFVYLTATGQQIPDSVLLVNHTAAPLPLDLYPADAFDAAGGGFALKKQTDKQTDVGSWIKLSKSRVVVPANGKVVVPFVVTIPRGTSPGDHTGGIVTQAEKVTPSVQGGATIGIKQAVGVRMYIRIQGPLTAQLHITNVHLKVQAGLLPFIGNRGKATLSYDIVNTGNVRVTPSSHVTFTGLYGGTLHDLGTQPTLEVLPGQSITVSREVSGMPTLNQVDARIQVTALGTATGANAIDTSTDAVAWSISWLFLLLIALVLVIIGLAVWNRRQAKGRGGRRGASRGRSPQPTQESAVTRR